MKVQQMTNNSGNTVHNQFIIYHNGNSYFQSYNSIIAVKKSDGTVELDSYYWNYSTTTGKYRNIFLEEDKKTTRQKIKSGEYTLTNLNA